MENLGEWDEPSTLQKLDKFIQLLFLILIMGFQVMPIIIKLAILHFEMQREILKLFVNISTSVKLVHLWITFDFWFTFSAILLFGFALRFDKIPLVGICVMMSLILSA